MQEENIVEKTFGKIKEFAGSIGETTEKNFYFVCGGKYSGKTCLIHYLLDPQSLEYGDNGEGEEVMTIIQKQDKFIQNSLLGIYRTEDQSNYYIQVPSLSEQFSNMEKFQFLVQLDALLKICQQGTVKILFLHDSASGDDQAAFRDFKQTMGVIKNFQKHSSFIVTKCFDEDEVFEVQNIVTSAIENNTDFQFLNTLVSDESLMFSFYAGEIDEDSQAKLVSDITDAPAEQIQLETRMYAEIIQFQISQTTKIRGFLENQTQKIVKIVSKQLKLICKALGGQNMAKCEKDFSDINTIWTEILNDQNDIKEHLEQSLKYHNQSPKKVIEKLQRMKQALDNQKPKFFDILFQQEENFDLLSVFTFAQKQIKPYAEVIIRVAKSLDFFTELVFTLGLLQEPEEGLSDISLFLVYKRNQEDFSERFVEQYKEKFDKIKGQGGKVKKKRIKRVKSYEQQKKQVIEDLKNIGNYFDLPLSPLKLDLFLDYLKDKMTKQNKTREDICDQKIIIRKVVQMFEFYELYQQAILCSAILPDFNMIQILIKAMVSKRSIDTLKSNDETIKFFESICYFCTKNRRKYIIEFLLDTPTFWKKETKDEFFEKIEDLSNNRKIDRKVFMNYAIAHQVFADQDKIIKDCIEYEKNHHEKLVAYHSIQYILKKKIQGVENLYEKE